MQGYRAPLGLLALGVGGALLLAHGLEHPQALPPVPVAQRPVAPVRAAPRPVRHVAVTWPAPTPIAAWAAANDLTVEQEGRVLQLLADAQATYAETRSIERQAFHEADDRLQAQLTDDERAVQADAIAEIMHPSSPEALETASATLNALYTRVKAAAPPDAQALDAAWYQLDSATDLADDTYAAMAEFLTDEQIGAFHLAFPVFSDLLDGASAPLALQP